MFLLKRIKPQGWASRRKRFSQDVRLSPAHPQTKAETGIALPFVDQFWIDRDSFGQFLATKQAPPFALTFSQSEMAASRDGRADAHPEDRLLAEFGFDDRGLAPRKRLRELLREPGGHVPGLLLARRGGELHREAARRCRCHGRGCIRGVVRLSRCNFDRLRCGGRDFRLRGNGRRADRLVTGDRRSGGGLDLRRGRNSNSRLRRGALRQGARVGDCACRGRPRGWGRNCRGTAGAKHPPRSASRQDELDTVFTRFGSGNRYLLLQHLPKRAAAGRARTLRPARLRSRRFRPSLRRE